MHAEALDIEICVLEFEGIESPFDQVYPSRQGFFALFELQHPADAELRYSGRTPSMWLCKYVCSPRFNPGIAMQNATMRSPSYAPNAWPPIFGHDDEKAHRQEIDVIEAPDGLLQFDRAFELIGLSEWLDFDGVGRSLAFGLLPQFLHFVDGGFRELLAASGKALFDVREAAAELGVGPA